MDVIFLNYLYGPRGGTVKIRKAMVALFLEFFQKGKLLDTIHFGNLDFNSVFRFKNATRMQILKMVNRVNVPVHDNAMIHYGEVLFALAKYHCGAKLPSDTKIYNKLQRQLTKKLPKFGTDDQVAINTIHAVLKCQRLWRTKTLKKKLARVKRQYSSVEKQRELIKKEVEKHFGERKKEEPIIIVKIFIFINGYA